MEKQKHHKHVSKSFPDCNASCMGVSSDGSKALLAGRRAFMLINLDDPNLPHKRFAHNHKWEPSVLEWNPSFHSSDLFATVLNQKVEVWSCRELSGSPRYVLGRHTRVVSDLNWKASETEDLSRILLTCSMDTQIYLWDLREHKRPMQTFTTVAGPSQVKWNKNNDYLFASAHDGDVRVWDTRKGNIPLAYIAAHLSKIHGLDWSPDKENYFVTASNDNTVKFWNISAPKQSKASLSTGAPVWRARYTPFGDGLLTVVVPSLRRDENNLHLWQCRDLSNPIHTFAGHQDVILEFQWRSRELWGHLDYQLVTWSKDQNIRISTVPPKVIKACNEHAGSHHQRRSMTSTSSPPSSPPLSPVHKSVDHEEKKTLEDERAISSFSQLPLDYISKHGDKDFEDKPEDQLLKELQKEFALININNPIVSFEELDAKQRICGVSAKIGSHHVKVNISFPLAYPNNVPPNFRFSKSTNIDHDLRARVMKALLDTANAHVKYNRTCLEPCVRQLVQQIEELSMREELFDTILTPPLSSFFPRGSASGSFGSYQDPAVPFPRYSGARFCGVDKLVIFTKPAKFTQVGNAGSEISLRSISALPAFISNMTVEESFDTSVFYFNPSLKGAAFPPCQEDFEEKDVATGGIQRRATGVTVICDVSGLLPIQKSLAKDYVVRSNDIDEICKVNLNAAKLLGRADLVRTWSLVSIMMEKSLYPNESNDERPWAAHPFGRRLVESLFSYYSQLRDVQTLALLSCVLSKQKLPPSLGLSPVKHRKGYTISDSSQGIVRKQRQSMYESQPHASPEILLGMYRSSSSSSVTGSMSPPAFIIERSESTDELKQEFRESCRLLNPALTKQYDNFKKAYADILYRWNLLTKRTEILKFVDELPSLHRGLDVLLKCESCPQTQRDARCANCKSIIVKCSVCRIGVRGLVSFCIACGHGGHLMHLMGWFQKMENCATGCGCSCLKNGSIVSEEEYSNAGYLR